MIGDPFEVVNDFDVDKFSVDFRIVIGHTGDRFLAVFATLVVDHVFEIDGYFHIGGGYFGLETRLVEVYEALYVFSKLHDVVFDLFWDKAILAVALGGSVGESMATVADFF